VKSEIMEHAGMVEKLLASRRELGLNFVHPLHMRKDAAEGGCGVIGIACSEAVAGRHLLQPLLQMRNRGNGKGGGVALAGLRPHEFGVTDDVLREAYFLNIAYLDESSRARVEAEYIEPLFETLHVHELPYVLPDGLPTAPPRVVGYFVVVKQGQVKTYADRWGLNGTDEKALDDELVYQNSFQLNKAFYASLGEKEAFVLSHGKDLLALKLVGYGEDVIRVYQLQDVHAHVWIGHHRYPTKGRVWHPGGAHPFVGLHEALVHNGDFANYASVTSYLAQHNIEPLFLTDTEVSVLMFDLLHRVFGYPLEYVIEALAPTTERDFSLLPPDKQEIYRMLQEVHIHGSPDGPWFFLIAQTASTPEGRREPRLIGITDTSMLRPQVFALQQGEPGKPSIGFAASEKQAIDAALTSIAREDSRFWTRPDLVWNARGGSHTDGGAFIFSVVRPTEGQAHLLCQDKFGVRIEIGETASPYRPGVLQKESEGNLEIALPSNLMGFQYAMDVVQSGSYAEIYESLIAMVSEGSDPSSMLGMLEMLSTLLDRRYPTFDKRRSSLLSIYDQVLDRWLMRVKETPALNLPYFEVGMEVKEPSEINASIVINAAGFPHEGLDSLAMAIRELVQTGYSYLYVFNALGHRFIANGLGPDTSGIHIEVFGSPGDYLASGIDGMEIVVHNSGQDQLAQIMKSGRLIVHGDVGQTFMYGAKGGEAYVLGNAAGRPLINAVGKPRVVINGTCLDYLAESFMAGDPLNGGGVIVLNGMRFSASGELVELDSAYPGGNLFSLASGGAICVRDPHHRLSEDQLNGGVFAPLDDRYWELIRPLLEENERLFGIRLESLLEVDGERMDPLKVYRLILPAGHKALQPEEAWVRH
jgi:glutamate synthase domain-containing protein 1/glutamate synthase domain-containing protein 3